ncbi:MAG: hypothetical protein CSA20_07585 [Deltaproteobacteria bacterium]|nr:MAG: hypothetical protein CSA20_07585 [Deltaproteobacteria bacterium]
MIFEGVKLLILGMTTVMLFLSLMILFIHLAAYLTKGETAKELAQIENERKMREQQRREARLAAAGADDDIAVIAAAVAAYEAERFARA